jgi:hypothetical protein
MAELVHGVDNTLRSEIHKLINCLWSKKELTEQRKESIVVGTYLYYWMTRVRAPTEAEDFSSSLCVQSGSGVHPASCTMGTGGPFPGGIARPRCDADHSPPSSAEVKNE